MAIRLIQDLLQPKRLSSGLLILCLGGVGLTVSIPKRAAAQTYSDGYSILPSNQSPSDGYSILPSRKPPSDGYSILPSHVETERQSRDGALNQPLQELKNNRVPLPVDSFLPKPTLPPIGASSAYLPSKADALGIHLIVKLSSRRVYVYKGEQALTSYPIAVGKRGWETPPGNYQVFSKEVNPIFKSFKTGQMINPGPDNPLGVRWIGIWTDGKTQLGFHGTNQPELIGQAVSHGCIRMRNKDVTALFEQVSVGTPVTVEP